MTTASAADSPAKGLPAWITRDLLDRTRQVWQKYYPNALTDLDAVGMLLATARLVDVLTQASPVLISTARASLP